EFDKLLVFFSSQFQQEICARSENYRTKDGGRKTSNYVLQEMLTYEFFIRLQCIPTKRGKGFTAQNKTTRFQRNINDKRNQGRHTDIGESKSNQFVQSQ